MSSDTSTWVSKYVVVRAGNLHNGERMNVAVLFWRTNVGQDSPVTCRLLKDWSRLETAFRWPPDLKEDIIARVSAIKTEGDYEKVSSKMGPYTPFEFSDERPTTDPTDREALLNQLVEIFLDEP